MYATTLVVARLRRAGAWIVRAKPIAPAAAAFAAIGYKAPGASRIGHLALSDWADAKDPAYRRVPRFMPSHLTTTRSDALRPKVSGVYISSALVGGTTNSPGVVARAS